LVNENALAAWQYPGSNTISSGGGSGGDSFAQEVKAYSCALTKTDFNTVTAYYKKRMGIQPGARESAANEPNVVTGEAIVTAGLGAIVVLEDSFKRPLRLVVLNRHWDSKAVSVVISRGTGETETHIALTYYEKSSPKKP